MAPQGVEDSCVFMRTSDMNRTSSSGEYCRRCSSNHTDRVNFRDGSAMMTTHKHCPRRLVLRSRLLRWTMKLSHAAVGIKLLSLVLSSYILGD